MPLTYYYFLCYIKKKNGEKKLLFYFYDTESFRNKKYKFKPYKYDFFCCCHLSLNNFFI